VHPSDLALGCSDLEMTWLLFCAGAATADYSPGRLLPQTSQLFYRDAGLPSPLAGGCKYPTYFPLPYLSRFPLSVSSLPLWLRHLGEHFSFRAGPVGARSARCIQIIFIHRYMVDMQKIIIQQTKKKIVARLHLLLILLAVY